MKVMMGSALEERFSQSARFPARSERRRAACPNAYVEALTMAGMLPWLAAAAKEAREKADPGRKQVHIAAELGVRESTISRFEDAKAWPKNPDRTLAGYAADLEIDVRDIWERALLSWQESEGASGAIDRLADEIATPDRSPATGAEGKRAASK